MNSATALHCSRATLTALAKFGGRTAPSPVGTCGDLLATSNSAETIMAKRFYPMGFSRIFYQIAKRRFNYSLPPHSNDLFLLHMRGVITKLNLVSNQGWLYHVRNQSAKNTYPPASSTG